MSKDFKDIDFDADEWLAEEFPEEEVVASKSNEELLAEYFGNEYVDSNVIKSSQNLDLSHHPRDLFKVE